MDCTNTNSSFTLVKALVLIYVLASCNISWGQISKYGHWELAAQSFTDTLSLKKEGSENIPLDARSYGFFAGYGKCLMHFKGRNCLFPSVGAGAAWALVESGSPSYTYKNTGAPIYNGLLGVGFKHHFSRSLSTALISGDVELRKANYKSPGFEYSIREENLAFHYWIRAQFNFPFSKRAAFYHSFLISPLNADFAYRIGVSLL